MYLKKKALILLPLSCVLLTSCGKNVTKDEFNSKVQERQDKISETDGYYTQYKKMTVSLKGSVKSGSISTNLDVKDKVFNITWTNTTPNVNPADTSVETMTVSAFLAAFAVMGGLVLSTSFVNTMAGSSNAWTYNIGSSFTMEGENSTTESDSSSKVSSHDKYVWNSDLLLVSASSTDSSSSSGGLTASIKWSK